jgi:nondiscriminating aspartyl-tRNA synthetase
MRTLAHDIASASGTSVTVQGWAHRIRDLGKIAFVVLRDRSGTVQVVIEGTPDFTLESVIEVSGPVRENPKAPGGFEVAAESVKVLARAEGDLPLSVNGDLSSVALDTILENRQLSLRNPKLLSAFRLQAALLRYFTEYLNGLGFVEIKTSKIIGTASEGGTGLFEVDYFGKPAYLAQSPQFFKQAMVASGLEQVFEVGYAYRAEKHDTPRHLNEYVSLDVETGFIESELDLIELEKGIFTAIFERVQKDCEPILSLYGATVPTPESVARSPIIGYAEALDIAAKVSGKRSYEIDPACERVLCEWSAKEKGSDIVFVNAFPRRARPFYAYPDGKNTKSFDCLFRGLEITTGGKRINEYPMMLESLDHFNLKPEPIEDYLSIFKYGCPPHGGFAIGLERLTQKILGLSSVKEAALFPRDRKRIKP